MQKALVVISCLLALTLAAPAEKKTDKRSAGYYHGFGGYDGGYDFDSEAEIGYRRVPVVENVRVPVTKHVSVPVRSSVNVPVVRHAVVPEVRYRPSASYSYGGYSGGYSSYSGSHGYDDGSW